MELFECERRSRKLLPIIKRALAIELHRRGMKVKEIAEVLGMTPAAVSQYIHGKRGRGKIDVRVENLAEKIIRGELKQEDVCEVCERLAEEIRSSS